MFDIANESDFEIEVMECDGDHIHLMVNIPYPRSMLIPSVILIRLHVAYEVFFLPSEQTFHKIQWLVGVFH